MPSLWADIDDEFGHWLAGFTDGEGCFMISKQTAVQAYGLRFCIMLRDDDLPILEEIARRVGHGRIGRQGKRGGKNPMAEWMVRDRRGLGAIVALFDRYPLRAKKARDFAIWRLAVAEHARCNPRQKDFDWSLMAYYKQELQTGRQYKPGPPLPVVLTRDDQMELA